MVVFLLLLVVVVVVPVCISCIIMAAVVFVLVSVEQWCLLLLVLHTFYLIMYHDVRGETEQGSRRQKAETQKAEDTIFWWMFKQKRQYAHLLKRGGLHFRSIKIRTCMKINETVVRMCGHHNITTILSSCIRVHVCTVVDCSTNHHTRHDTTRHDTTRHVSSFHSIPFHWWSMTEWA